MVVEAEHDLAIHLQKPAVAVPGETRVAADLGEALDGRVVEAEVEHRIHHPRHRGARARAHRNEQRVFRIAQLGAERLLDGGERGGDLGLEFRRIAAVLLVIVGADLGGDRETRRHRQPQARHLGEIGAFAAEQVLHVGPPLGRAAAKAVDPLGHVSGLSFDLGEIGDLVHRRYEFAPAAADDLSRKFFFRSVNGHALEKFIDGLAQRARAAIASFKSSRS